MAALLHDAIEDQEIPAETIAQMFIRDVAEPVRVHKALQIASAPQKCPR